MYCDYSDLSRDFTLSFRVSYEFQPLSQIRKHNSNYYWLSKILKTTVTEYGQCHEYGKGLLSPLRGPFFCGMSAVLKISQFNMFILSPLSSSLHIEVALKFSGDSGMVLEMDNSSSNCVYLQGLDVSWISRYREEEERYKSIYVTYRLLNYDL